MLRICIQFFDIAVLKRRLLQERNCSQFSSDSFLQFHYVSLSPAVNLLPVDTAETACMYFVHETYSRVLIRQLIIGLSDPRSHLTQQEGFGDVDH